MARTKTTTQRGLGWRHQQDRDRLLRNHIDGTPCWWCNQPMYRNPENNWDAKALAADHSKSRAFHGTNGNHADRPLHDTCNKQRGNGSRDHQRPAITGRPIATKTPADPRLMPWPW